jgi:hypothetical protein
MIQKNQFNNITWTAVAAMVVEAAMVATEISRKVWHFQGLHAAYGIMKKLFKKCGILSTSAAGLRDQFFFFFFFFSFYL